MVQADANSHKQKLVLLRTLIAVIVTGISFGFVMAFVSNGFVLGVQFNAQRVFGTGGGEVMHIGFKPQHLVAPTARYLHQRGNKGGVFHPHANFSTGVTK